MNQINWKETILKSKWFDVLRWIGLLPASIICSLLSYYIVVILNALTMSHFISPESFMGKFYLYAIGGCVMGVVGVYSATYIAPSYKKQVGIVMAGFLLFLSVGPFFTGHVMNSYWTALAMICMNIGSITLTYGIFRQETTVQNINND